MYSMNMSEAVWVLNPKVSQYEKKYIWGLGSQSIKIFTELCSRRIYINGFVDEKWAGISFFHKPVYSMEECERENAILLTLDMRNKERKQACSEILVINEKLQGKKIMIYGAGFIGKSILSVLQEKGMEVLGFIDSDDEKTGTEICGIKVYGKNILNSLSEDIAVIEAGKGVREIDCAVKSANERLMRFYLYDNPFTSSVIWVDQSRNIALGLNCLFPLSEYYENNNVKELIFYGNDIPLAEKYAGLYDCLGFSPISLMTSEKNMATEHITLIDEILYKTDYLILLYETDGRPYLEKLRELGIERECGYVNYEYSPGFYNRKSMLDVNLGYTYEMNSKYPGIYLYGRNHKDDYKIAVLGGSTTDSVLDRKNRSWVEIMYRKYCTGNITVFNGAVSGYDSAQEMTKLVRDIMKLRPDMVIVYDGFNDVFNHITNKFWYLESLVRFAGRHMKCFDMYIEDAQVWKGIQLYEDLTDDWLENIRYMYTIANSCGARFFSFIQPMFFSKKYLDKHSGGLMQMMNHIYTQELMESTRKFRNKAEGLGEGYSYIKDLSDIFDDVDVYMDICHVYERGNERIAECIWDTIKPYVEAEK